MASADTGYVAGPFTVALRNPRLGERTREGAVPGTVGPTGWLGAPGLTGMLGPPFGKLRAGSPRTPG